MFLSCTQNYKPVIFDDFLSALEITVVNLVSRIMLRLVDFSLLNILWQLVRACLGRTDNVKWLIIDLMFGF